MIMMDTNSNAGTKKGLVVGGDEVKTGVEPREERRREVELESTSK